MNPGRRSCTLFERVSVGGRSTSSLLDSLNLRCNQWCEESSRQKFHAQLKRIQVRQSSSVRSASSFQLRDPANFSDFMKKAKQNPLDKFDLAKVNFEANMKYSVCKGMRKLKTINDSKASLFQRNSSFSTSTSGIRPSLTRLRNEDLRFGFIRKQNQLKLTNFFGKAAIEKKDTNKPRKSAPKWLLESTISDFWLSSRRNKIGRASCRERV